MRHLTTILAAGAMLLSTSAAYADLGDQLFKLLPSDGFEGDRFGVSVAISGTIAIIGAHKDDDACQDDPAFCQSGSAYLFNTTTGTQIAKLLAADDQQGDEFGYSVAISGSIVIVGAPFDDDNGLDSGSAYLFDTATGLQIAKLLPNDGAADDFFGYSVAISGTTAIVGAFGDDDNGFNSGSAYLFDTTTGQQIAKLLPDDGEAVDQFGRSVAISGATAIVGAPREFLDRGAAYLFDTATGQQIAKLLASDGREFDQFGHSVAISGTTAIVGAWLDDDGCFDDDFCESGSAYLFDTTTGQQIAKLTADEFFTRGDLFGSSVAISGTTAIVGAYGRTDNGLDSGSAYLFDTATGLQIAKLLADDGVPGDFFGASVAISEETAIIGAWGDNDNGFNTGSAYLFDATTVPQTAELLADDGAEADLFGRSISISGTTAIVGAPLDDDNGNNSGSAYLVDTATGQQIAKLLPDDGAADDWFGSSVAISGSTAIVGNYRDDDNGQSSGSAYLFDTNGQQRFKLLPGDGAAGDSFGESVGISGSVAIVGARLDDDNGTNSGSAYLFNITTGQQIIKLLPNDGAAGDWFGLPVAISGNTVIIGAAQDDDLGDKSGSAYIFREVGRVWKQITKLTASDGAADDRFGVSVGISGDTAIIGAWGDDDNGSRSGSAYIFRELDGVWTQLAKLTASDAAFEDFFGQSVGIFGDIAVIGAHRVDDAGADSGSAYVFWEIGLGWVQAANLTGDDGAAGDQFGFSVAVSNTAVVVGAVLHDHNGTDSGSAYVFGVISCLADCTGDGGVDIVDFLCFLNLFVAGDPDADCNRDGTVNTLDFLCFLNAFIEGC